MRVLVNEWHHHRDAKRLAEMRESLSKNISSDSFDEITLFALNRGGLSGLNLDKVRIVDCTERPSFRDIIEFCNTQYMDAQCVVANNDIEFPPLTNSFPIARSKDLIAVSRHELKNGKAVWFDHAEYYGRQPIHSIPPHAFSNDAWIFNAPIRLKGGKRIMMGQMGCDQRFLWLAFMSGMTIRHATKSFQVLHHHENKSRNWNSSNRAAMPGIVLDEEQRFLFYWRFKNIVQFDKIDLIELLLTVRFMMQQIFKRIFFGAYDDRVT